MSLISKIKNKFEEVNKDLGIDPRSKKIYAITALFETPDDIMVAAAEVSNLGYKKFDVNTPYPIHGMDDAMKLKPTKLGLVVFVLAAMGTIGSLLMIGYMMGIDYQINIGGKPFFSLPPSIPITFELTVLFGAIASIIFALFLFNKLPWVNNPLMDTEYMKRVSSDRYGILIRSNDEKFNPDEVVKLFEVLGSKDINHVYQYETEESEIKTPIFNVKFVLILILVAFVTSISTYLIENKVTYMLPFDWMWEQSKLNPQKTTNLFNDGYGMRTPVNGTVPRDNIPYMYKGMPDSLVKFMSNPLPVTQSILEKGKLKFNTYCSPCHGYFAKGDSRLNGQFPNPPSLHSDKVRNWKDGNIFHVIVNGQNVMPSYAKQILSDDIWAIIHYIRVLQRSQNATDADMQAK
jgi:hypothetical protein